MKILKILGIAYLVLAAMHTATGAAAATITVHDYDNGSGSFIYISGRIQTGDDKDLKEIVESNPKIDDVWLHSGGGRARTAWKMAEIIRSNGLNTGITAKSTCASACSMVFVGGVVRRIDSDGQIGFHSAYVSNDWNVPGVTTGQAWNAGFQAALDFIDTYTDYVDFRNQNKVVGFLIKAWRNNGASDMLYIDGNKLVRLGFATDTL